MRFTFALIVGKLISFIISIIDRERGTSLPGEKMLKIDPDMLSKFKGLDPEKIILVTGTNGKSTTTNLIVHLLRSSGKKVVSNIAGANLLPGVITAVMKSSDLGGNVEADFFVFETDERFLPKVVEQLHPRNVLITNLQKDQVQRNGDPDFIVRKIAAAMEPGMRVFVNNDEPRSRSFSRYTNEFVSFGVAKNAESFTKDATFPTMACPVCRHKIKFDYYNTDGIGKFACVNCDHRGADEPDFLLSDVDFENKTFTVKGQRFEMPYDAPYMCYNYAGAIAVGSVLGGLSLEEMAPSVLTFINIAGRYELFTYGNREVKYFRIKQENPETLQQFINTVARDPRPKDIFIGLFQLVDFIPHYYNAFYMYDCDFELLETANVRKYISFSRGSGYDAAARLVYAGVPEDRIEVIDSDDIEKLCDAIEAAQSGNIYMVTWLHSFEAIKKYIKGGKNGERP